MRPLALIAHPSPDVYGADLQMLRTVDALRMNGWEVVVCLPRHGALAPMIIERGADVVIVEYPVLRKSELSPRRIVQLAAAATASLVRIRGLIRARQPALVIVNTVTLPWWIAGARLASTPVICHLHEAEVGMGAWKGRALMSPLVLAKSIIVISDAAMSAMTEAIPWLRSRSTLIYNGVSQPPHMPRPYRPPDRPRILVIGRLSPRKAPDLALEAVALLRSRGYDVELEIAGTPFEGYEWYERQLRARADCDDLRGHVTFAGYASPIWPHLDDASIVVQPTQYEPFGLAVVEAQFALRPVVASGALGHLETISHEVTGLLSKPGDVESIADNVARLLDNPDEAIEITQRARLEALNRFSTDRYAREVAQLAAATART